MIKRTYFMVFRKSDSSGKYAENSMTATSKSWFPCPDQVFDECKAHAEEQLNGEPGDFVFCTQFSRL